MAKQPVRTRIRWVLSVAGCLALIAALAGTLLLAPSGAAEPGMGSWAPTEAPSTARTEHAALTLSDGGVLVAGGADATGTPLAAVEHFDGATDRWKLLAFLKLRRKLHSATLTSGAKVLVAGGIGASGALSSAELYDPGTNSWELTTGSLGTARSNHTATPLPGGKVLIAGGIGQGGARLSSAEVYDPATNSFSAADSLSIARSGHSATSLPGGKVLVAGGAGPLSSAEVYDPVTNSFSAADSLAEGRSGHSATALPGGQVLLAGGTGQEGPLSSAERYDPSGNAFSPAPGLSTERSGHSATLIADGRVLIAGGRGTGGAALASSELYDPAGGASEAGTFSTRTTDESGNATPLPRAGHTATLLTDGRVLVAGGSGHRSAEVFDPALARFSRSSARKGQPGEAVVLNGPACRAGPPVPSYCGKLLDAGNGVMTELFDPVANSWSGCAAADASCVVGPGMPGNLNFERSGSATLTLLDGPECRGGSPPAYCGKALLVGGGGTGTLPTVDGARIELYDPATGRWSSCDSAASASADCPAPYPGGAAREHTATLLTDGGVLIAGGSGGVTYYGSRRDFYIYNPALGRWSQPGALYNGRRLHRAVLLEGGTEQCGTNCGKVLLVGGEGEEGVQPTAELIDPRAGVSGASTPTPQMISSRPAGHSATLLPSGHVVVAGGLRAPTDAEYFDPKAGATGAFGDIAASLRAPRSDDHTATLLPTGSLLFAGGRSTDAGELYDPYVGGGRSVFTGQGPARAQTAALLPAGPWSFCRASCGKVALTDANSSSASYGWLYSAKPELTALAPTGGSGAGGTVVTIEGRGLASVTSVRFGSLEATSLKPDSASPDEKLTLLSPPHPAGTVPVTVTGSGGRSPATESAQFTYTAASPGTGGGGSSGGDSPLVVSAPGAGGSQTTTLVPQGAGNAAALAAERVRARAFRGCLSSAARHTRRENLLARSGSTRSRALARRHARRHARSLRARCVRLHGRTPGRVTGLGASAAVRKEIVLSFRAPGTDRNSPPPARGYLIKQSTTPITDLRSFRRAQTLCNGSCRFPATGVGEQLKLRITDLRPRTTYYYAVAARDNVTRRLGPRSGAVRVRTR